MLGVEGPESRVLEEGVRRYGEVDLPAPSPRYAVIQLARLYSFGGSEGETVGAREERFLGGQFLFEAWSARFVTSRSRARWN